MDSEALLHRRNLKRSKHPLSVESPAYDASEEDNDLIDDAASAKSVHSGTPRSHKAPSSPLAKSTLTATATVPSQQHATSQFRRINAVLSDDGVDSPTYDGDIESSATIAPSSSIPPYGGIGGVPAPSKLGANQSGSGSTPTPTSPASSSSSSRPQTRPQAPIASTREPPVPAAAKDAFNPASLTVEDIQAFIQSALSRESPRAYTINQPPADRPIRIYADGVYDLFHFGHALQLRQAKLSFSSVYLLVGVCSDELVAEYKARSVMTHAERCESVRHCRWVDQVVEDAPWIIDQAFLDKYQIDYVAHDDDPYAGVDTDDVYGYVKSKGQFIPTRRTPGISTSSLLERIVSTYRKGHLDRKLELMGHSELKAESDYDSSVDQHQTAPQRRSGHSKP